MNDEEIEVRRKAFEELIALTEEYGLYDDDDPTEDSFPASALPPLDGSVKSVVKFITGFTDEEIDELGGIDDHN